MRNLERSIWALAIAAILFSCGKKPSNPETPQINKDSTGQTNNSNDNQTNPDEDFAMEAAEGGLFEVMAGELAVHKGSAKIKKLGQMMVDDHSKANDDLKKIAKKKNLDLPTSLSNEMQAEYDKLMKKEGKEFDKAYSTLMVKDHKKDIEKFQKEADNGGDADFKNFASEKLPTLRHHLQMSQEAKDHCDAM
jgi:putative membrane protein